VVYIVSMLFSSSVGREADGDERVVVDILRASHALLLLSFGATLSICIGSVCSPCRFFL
jgi:hypothetical protein